MSQQTTSQEKPHCRYCEKELRGRLGKIFCNVDCKNNYNSRIRSAKRAKENELFPKVIKTIKSNYRILHEYNLDKLIDGEQLIVKKDDLKKRGFDPNYCTNAYFDSDQSLWKSCFKLCWQDVGEYYYLKYSQY